MRTHVPGFMKEDSDRTMEKRGIVLMTWSFWFRWGKQILTKSLAS